MPGIPESLMERLHHAIEQFHQARLLRHDMEWMDANKLESVADALRSAEKELEDVTREIDLFLPAPTSPSPERSS